MKKIGILNGPNLNLLGKREPKIYGTVSFENFLNQLTQQYLDVNFIYAQSNVEGELINTLQDWNEQCDALIFNPGGYSHTSVAVADALRAMHIPVIEVHISNIYAREAFRHQSITAANCKGCIIGFGLDGYKMATQYLISL